MGSGFLVEVQEIYDIELFENGYNISSPIFTE